MKNLYYSLPDSVIYEINKRVFSMEVIPAINKIIPKGDFSFMITEGSTSYWDRILVRIFTHYYNLLHEIGPEAWKYIYSKRHHQRIISDDDMWILIKSKLDLYGNECFEKGINYMQHISRTGWDRFVKDYFIAQRLSK